MNNVNIIINCIGIIIQAIIAGIALYGLFFNRKKDKESLEMIVEMKEFYKLQLKKEEIKKIHYLLLSKISRRIFSNQDGKLTTWTKNKKENNTEDITEQIIREILEVQASRKNENQPKEGDNVWSIDKSWFTTTAEKMNMGIYDFLILKNYQEILNYYKEKNLM